MDVIEMDDAHDDDAGYDKAGYEETTFSDPGAGASLDVRGAMPPWADSDVPPGTSQEDLADEQQTEALIERERGEVQANLEFTSTTGDKLWLRWGRKWLLLTNVNKPGEFLAPSTLRRYGANVGKALGLGKATRVSAETAATLQKSVDTLRPGVGGDIQTAGNTAIDVTERTIAALRE